MIDESRKYFHYQVGANPLGGHLDTPTPQDIPAHAFSSLPSAGGYVESRGEVFNFQQIISCTAAYTRLSGRETDTNTKWSVLLTSVVEGLNILEAVEADRVVTQISVDFHHDTGPVYHFIGSHIDGLRIGGFNVKVIMNDRLLGVGEHAKGARAGVTHPIFAETGQQQAGKLLKSAGDADEKTGEWLKERFGWMAPGKKKDDCKITSFSLVEGFEGEHLPEHYGHTIIIPEIGKIIFGEVYEFPCNGPVMASMIRAELGCNVVGTASVGGGSVGGTTMPPS
jgi:hypothetical protein